MRRCRRGTCPRWRCPELFGNGAGTYWPGRWHWHDVTAYAGLLPLLLVVLALRRPRTAWVWYCVAVAASRWCSPWAATLPSTAGRTSGYRATAASGSGRHLVLVSLMLALLAGRGADRLLAGRGRRGVLAALFAVLLGGAALAAGAAAGADALAPAVVPALTGWGSGRRATSCSRIPSRRWGSWCSSSRPGPVVWPWSRLPWRWWRCCWPDGSPPASAGALLVLAVFADLTLFGWRYLHTPQPLAEHVAFDAPAAQYRSYLGDAAVAGCSARPLANRHPRAGRGGRGQRRLRAGRAAGDRPRPAPPTALRGARGARRRTPRPGLSERGAVPREHRFPLWPLLNARYRLEPETPCLVAAAVRVERDARGAGASLRGRRRAPRRQRRRGAGGARPVRASTRA